MARTEFTVQEPALDTSKSLATKKITATNIDNANGHTLKGVGGVKDNSLVIVANITTGGTLTFKAGELQNKVQGDLTVTLDASSVNTILIERPTRFMKKDGSVDIDVATATGTIYAVGKHAGLSA